jgi:hypothetical protein
MNYTAECARFRPPISVFLKLVAGRFTVNRDVSFRRFCVGPPISSDRPRSSMEIGPLDASGSGGAGGEAAPLPVASLANELPKTGARDGRPPAAKSAD